MSEAADASESEAESEESAEQEESKISHEEQTETNENDQKEKSDLTSILKEIDGEEIDEQKIIKIRDYMAQSNLSIEDLPSSLRAIIYAAKNIFNLISKKEYVDKKVNEWLSQNLKGKHIYIALHGMWQTYWSSFADLVEYCEQKGIVIVPIKSNSAKDICNTISALKEKTGAKLHVIAHSRGGKYALDSVIDHGLGKLVQEIILSGTPTHNLDGTLRREEYAAIGKKVNLTNIYGSTDQILSFFGHKNYGNLPNANSIKVDEGHLGLLHNPTIFDMYFRPNVYYTSAPQQKIYYSPISNLKQVA